MKLNTKRTLLVGLAFLSISAFWQLYGGVVPLVLKSTGDILDDAAGITMALMVAAMIKLLTTMCKNKLAPAINAQLKAFDAGDDC